MKRTAGRAAGCASGVVLAIVLVVVVVGWSLSAFGGVANPFRTYPQVPSNVPPGQGEPVPWVDTSAAGRTADGFTAWSQPLSQDTGIPVAALNAYANAQLIAQQAWPQCQLSWTTLAGIGYVETRHGSYNGSHFKRSSIDPDGVVRPTIVGVPLDGTGGNQRILDTDKGELDGDNQLDRAVGPMQFIPSSWARYGLDANGDGVATVNHIDDAAAAAAQLLCNGTDLSTAEGWSSAVRRYNNSQEYLVKVRNAANAYAQRQPAI